MWQEHVAWTWDILKNVLRVFEGRVKSKSEMKMIIDEVRGGNMLGIYIIDHNVV